MVGEVFLKKVVNCFQLSIFEISNTAADYVIISELRCELLSIKYL